MAQRLIPKEVMETWEECLLLGETDKDFFDKATEVGAELVRVLGELNAGPAESVAALIVLAWRAAEVLIAEAKALNEELQNARRR